MLAAVQAVRRLDPARVVVAVPTAARDTCRELAAYVDDLVAVLTPDPFYAVGLWYEDFSQVTDEEVRELLAHATTPETGADTGRRSPAQTPR